MTEKLKRLVAHVSLAAALTGFVWAGTVAALAHNAHSVAMPLGWKYPMECCHDRDCAELPARYVKETPEGFLIDMPPGSHPMLKTKGYRGVVPYKAVRDSPDGAYHICLSMEGNSRYCFFAGSRGF